MSEQGCFRMATMESELDLKDISQTFLTLMVKVSLKELAHGPLSNLSLHFYSFKQQYL